MASSCSRSCREASQEDDLPRLLANVREVSLPGAAVSDMAREPIKPQTSFTQAQDMSFKSDAAANLCKDISKALDACKVDVMNIIYDMDTKIFAGKQAVDNLDDHVAVREQSFETLDEHLESITPLSRFTISASLPSDKEWLKPARSLADIHDTANRISTQLMSPPPSMPLKVQKRLDSVVSTAEVLPPPWRVSVETPEALVWRKSHLKRDPSSLQRRVFSTEIGPASSPLKKRFKDLRPVCILLRILSCLLIGFDIVLITHQCDMKVQSAIAGLGGDAIGPSSFEKYDTTRIFSLCIAVFFSLELALSMLLEWHYRISGAAKWWLVLDIVTVVSSWADMSEEVNGIGVSRCGKALRLLRVARLTQKQFPSFAKTMLCVVQCSHVLIPIFSVLMSVFYVIGLIIMSGVQTYASGATPDAVILEDMKDVYGSMMRTLMTLAEAFLELRSEESVYGPLLEMHWIYRMCFLCSWFFVLSVIANAMIGEVAMAISRVRRPTAAELVVEGAVKEQEHAEHLYAIVSSLDVDANGKLSPDEFRTLSDDPVWQGYLHMLGISTSCAERIFRAFNGNGKDEVDVREFAAALLHVKGTATQFDMLDVKRLVVQLGREVEPVVRRENKLARQEGTLSSIFNNRCGSR